MASTPISASKGPNTGSNETQTFAFTALTALFFMWGFLTSLNDILIPHLKAVFDLTYLQASLIQFTFFSAYFIMSIPSGKIIERIGYKNGVVVGLGTSGLGAFLFYPAAALPSYGVFLTALFILATGITILQVAANPYVSILGKPETASSRLNLSQAFNSLGTTIAPYFGGLVILSASALSIEQIAKLSGSELQTYKLAEAASVQVPYLGLGITLFVMAIIFAFLKLPNITEAAEPGESHTFAEVLKISHLKFAVIGIFVYVGAEVSIGSYLVNFISNTDIAGLTEKQASGYVSLYWGGAMIGRFIGSALMQKIKPGKLLGLFALVASLLTLTTILSTGTFAMIAILSVGLFNSIMFPTIFTLGINDLGKYTSKGSSLLIMAIVGGAILPVAMGAMADTIGIQTAFFLPAICYLYIAYFGFKGSKVNMHL
jgi:MFS transporter, FHS family, L-fucose permease